MVGRQQGRVFVDPQQVVAGFNVIGRGSPGQGAHGVEKGVLHLAAAGGNGPEKIVVQQRGFEDMPVFLPPLSRGS